MNNIWDAVIATKPSFDHLKDPYNIGIPETEVGDRNQTIIRSLEGHRLAQFRFGSSTVIATKPSFDHLEGSLEGEYCFRSLSYLHDLI